MRIIIDIYIIKECVILNCQKLYFDSINNTVLNMKLLVSVPYLKWFFFTVFRQLLDYKNKIHWRINRTLATVHYWVIFVTFLNNSFSYSGWNSGSACMLFNSQLVTNQFCCNRMYMYNVCSKVIQVKKKKKMLVVLWNPCS